MVSSPVKEKKNKKPLTFAKFKRGKALVIHLAQFWPRGEAALVILEVNAAVAVNGDIPSSAWAPGKKRQLKPKENLDGETGEE